MEHFQKRGYKHSQIQREITTAKLVPRDQALKLSRLKQKLHHWRYPICGHLQPNLSKP